MFPMSELLPKFNRAFTSVHLKNNLLEDNGSPPFSKAIRRTGLGWPKGGYAVSNEGCRRAIIKSEFIGDNVEIAAIDIMAEPFDTFLCTKRSDGGHELFIDEKLFCEDMYVVVYGFGQGGKIKRITLEKPVFDYVSTNERIFKGLACFKPLEDDWGVLILGMHPTNGGEACITTPFEFQPPLWKVNREKKRHHSISGKEISCRQDFPDVFEVDGALAIFRACDLDRLQDFHGKGNCLSFFCDLGVNTLRTLPRLGRRLSCGENERKKSANASSTLKREGPLEVLKFLLVEQSFGFINNSIEELPRPEMDLLRDSISFLGFKIGERRRFLMDWLFTQIGIEERLKQINNRFDFFLIGCCIGQHDREFWELLQALRSRGRYLDGLSLLDAITDDTDASWQVDLQKGVTYWMMGDYKTALNYSRLSVRKNNSHPYSYLNMGLHFFCLGKTKRPIQCFEKVLHHVPNDLLATAYGVVVFYLNGDTKSAYGWLCKLNRRDSLYNNLTRHHNLFVVCFTYMVMMIWILERAPILFSSENKKTADSNKRRIFQSLPALILSSAAGFISPNETKNFFAVRVCSLPDETWRDKIKEIILLRSKGEIDKSTTVCHQAKGKIGVDFWIQMGLNMQIKSQYESALKHFSMAEACGKSSDWLAYMQGVCNFKMGRYHDVLNSDQVFSNAESACAYGVLKAAALTNMNLDAEASTLLEELLRSFTKRNKIADCELD